MIDEEEKLYKTRKMSGWGNVKGNRDSIKSINYGSFRIKSFSSSDCSAAVGKLNDFTKLICGVKTNKQETFALVSGIFNNSLEMNTVAPTYLAAPLNSR